MGFCGEGVKASAVFLEVWFVKFYLTDGQVLRLLCIGGQCNLFTVRSIHSTENAMTNEILTVRFAQALLAVGVTAASVFVFQFALLV
jgi:hypothetical protein